MVAQFFQDCVGFKIFLAGLKKKGFDVNPFFDLFPAKVQIDFVS
jgi:hypothetical protein